MFPVLDQLQGLVSEVEDACISVEKQIVRVVVQRTRRGRYRISDGGHGNVVQGNLTQWHFGTLYIASTIINSS
jgi:hypothetical protein